MVVPLKKYFKSTQSTQYLSEHNMRGSDELQGVIKRLRAIDKKLAAEEVLN